MTEFIRRTWHEREESPEEIIAPLKDIFDTHGIYTEEFLVWHNALSDVRDLREKEADLNEAKKKAEEEQSFVAMIEAWEPFFAYAHKKDHIMEHQTFDPEYKHAFVVITGVAARLEHAYRGSKDPSLEATVQLSDMEGYVAEKAKHV